MIRTISCVRVRNVLFLRDGTKPNIAGESKSRVRICPSGEPDMPAVLILGE